MQIFVAKSGKATGPFSEDQLRSMLNSGMLGLTDPAWHEGITEWLPLHEVLKISPPPSQPAPPPVAQVAVVEPMHTARPTPAAHLPERTMSQEISEPSWQDSAKSALRWLLFIPGGLLAGVLFSLIFAAILHWFTGGGFLAELLVGLITAVCAGTATVGAGCSIAPSLNKAVPAKIIGAVSIVMLVLGMLYYLINANWRFVFQTTVSLVAVVCAVREMVERDEKRG